MKKNSFFKAFGILPLALFILPSFGQNQAGNNFSFDKKTIIASANAAPDAASMEELKSINKKAFADFSKHFQGASDIRISNHNKEIFIYFVRDGVSTRVGYDKKGNWHHTIRYYGEDLLPKEVRAIVKSTYYDYNIFSVTEVTVGDKTAHLVNIEDKTSWKTLKIVDGEMEVMQEYTKG
jgi:hypothetical protein